MKTAIPSGWMLKIKTLYGNFINRLGNLKYGVLVLMALCVCNTVFSQTVALIEISNQVVNNERNEPLPDVSVQIKGSITGTITDRTGSFVLKTKQKLPFTLVFSSIR